MTDADKDRKAPVAADTKVAITNAGTANARTGAADAKADTANAGVTNTGTETTSESQATPAPDQLEGSPVLAEVLGDALPQLALFHAKLAKEGEPRGIIGPRDVGIIWERHILNSAAIVPFIRDVAGEGPTIADIGSGGGFPGIIVAAMLPKAKVTLIEPMERRVEWLHEVVDELGLKNVRIMRARSEEAIAQHRHFEVVTCRAVAPMTKLAGWTLPLLRSGGHLVALKGRSAQAEIDKAEKELRKRKAADARVLDAPVGPGLEPTHVVIVTKR